MNKTISIPQHLTADLFGCQVDYFQKHLRGRQLPVVSETAHFITVEDSNEEQWTVNKSDLQPKEVDA